MRLALVADELFPRGDGLFLLLFVVAFVGIVLYANKDERVGDVFKGLGGFVLGAVFFCAFWFVVGWFGTWLHERFDSGVVALLGAIGLAVGITAVMCLVGGVRERRASTVEAAENTDAGQL